MAFFGAPFQARGPPSTGCPSGPGIVRGLEQLSKEGDSPQVGGGVGTGDAFMANVAEGEVSDFTIIGDVVNTAARLQGAAASGEVIVLEETYQSVADLFPGALRRSLDLKGKAEPVAVRVLESKAGRQG